MTYPPPPNLPAPDSRYAPVPIAVTTPRSAGTAVALELVPGLFGIFGIGNIYAGRTARGVILMLSFWLLFWINVVLVFLFIGIITMPLTWVAYLVVGPVTAARAVEDHNSSTAW
jgi:TM2 domain-containing membrane protein YozV